MGCKVYKFWNWEKYKFFDDKSQVGWEKGSQLVVHTSVRLRSRTPLFACNLYSARNKVSYLAAGQCAATSQNARRLSHPCACDTALWSLSVHLLSFEWYLCQFRLHPPVFIARTPSAFLRGHLPVLFFALYSHRRSFLLYLHRARNFADQMGFSLCALNDRSVVAIRHYFQRSLLQFRELSRVCGRKQLTMLLANYTFVQTALFTRNQIQLSHFPNLTLKWTLKYNVSAL